MLTVSEEPLKYTSLSSLTLLQDEAANNSQALKIYIISVLWFGHGSMILHPGMLKSLGMVRSFGVFERSLFCSPRLHLFDEKYSENNKQ